MSEADVDLVRSIYSGGDLEAVLDSFSPDVEWDFTDRVFNPEIYRGHDGVRAWQRELEDVWDDWENEVERVVDAGDSVVAIVRSKGRGRGSGVELSERWAQVWTIRDGLVTSVRHFRDPARALKAVGLAAE